MTWVGKDELEIEGASIFRPSIGIFRPSHFCYLYAGSGPNCSKGRYPVALIAARIVRWRSFCSCFCAHSDYRPGDLRPALQATADAGFPGVRVLIAATSGTG
jgi:hypothetical protein